MASWWGGMSGTQVVDMAQNIFNSLQRQQLLKREQEQQAKQQETENFFKRMQLDMQKQQLNLQGERQKLELEFDEKRAAREEKAMQREQETWNKVNEYSQGLSEMIPTLDFSDPESMKKLYAYQTKYQPYGIKPEYIKPEKPEAAKEMSQEEYSNLVFKTWNELKDHVENKYKADAKAYEGLGFFAKRQAPEPELTLPTIDDAKRLVNDMLQKGISPEEITVTPPAETIPQGPQYRLGTQQLPFSQMGLGQKAALAMQPFKEIFNPAQRKYNNLSPREKAVADRYMQDTKASLEDTLQMIEAARKLRAK